VTGRYLLDTTAAIAVVKGESAILEFVTRAAEVFAPVIVTRDKHFTQVPELSSVEW